MISLVNEGGGLRSAAESFLRELCVDARGQILFANLHDSITAKLVSPTFVAEFFRECLAGKSLGAASAQAAIVGASLSVDAHNTPRFLRKSRVRSTSLLGMHFRHVSAWSSFWVYHHDAHHVAKLIPSGIPAVSSGLTRSQVGAAQQYMTQAIGVPGWSQVKGRNGAKDDGFFGLPLPAPSSCWISTDAFDSTTTPHVVGIDDATDARDSLGLIDNQKDAVLVRYSIEAAAAYHSVIGDMAVPTFADVGNTRFRVRDKSVRARMYRSQEWGSTVNLASLPKHRRLRVTGLPERVSRALKIREQSVLRAEVLGFVSCNRGSTPHDNDDAFATYLIGSRKLDSMIDRVLRALPMV